MAWCAGIGYGNAPLVAGPRAPQPTYEEGLYTASWRGLRGSEKELDVAPPPGFAWTLKCIRSGASSAAAAIDISLSKIRRQGDWSASSMVPERKYIDAMVVSTDAARRFFGWLSHGA